MQKKDKTKLSDRKIMGLIGIGVFIFGHWLFPYLLGSMCLIMFGYAAFLIYEEELKDITRPVAEFINDICELINKGSK